MCAINYLITGQRAGTTYGTRDAAEHSLQYFSEIVFSDNMIIWMKEMKVSLSELPVTLEWMIYFARPLKLEYMGLVSVLLPLTCSVFRRGHSIDKMNV